MANNAITTLLSLGNDAMDNMYDVYYSPAGGENEMHLTGRLEGFNPPAWKPGTHEIGYHGQKITLPSTKLEFTRELELTFRLDSNYQWYDYWRSLAIYAGNAVTGGVANAPVNTGTLKVLTVADDMVGAGSKDAPAIYGQETKEAVNNNGHAGMMWVYYDCWVSDVTEPQFKTDGGDVQSFTVKLYFGRCKYPASDNESEWAQPSDNNYIEKTSVTNGSGQTL